jgi:hypothetical protein
MIETKNRVLFGLEELDRVLGHTYNVSGISQGSLNFIVCDKPEQEEFFFNYLKDALTENNIHLSNEIHIKRKTERDFDEVDLNAYITQTFQLNIYHQVLNVNPKIYIIKGDTMRLGTSTNQLILMERNLAALRNKLLLLNVTLFVLIRKTDFNMSNSYRQQADNVLFVNYNKIDDIFNISKGIRFMVDKARQGKSRIAIEYFVKERKEANNA